MGCSHKTTTIACDYYDKGLTEGIRAEGRASDFTPEELVDFLVDLKGVSVEEAIAIVKKKGKLNKEYTVETYNKVVKDELRKHDRSRRKKDNSKTGSGGGKVQQEVTGAEPTVLGESGEGEATKPKPKPKVNVEQDIDIVVEYKKVVGKEPSATLTNAEMVNEINETEVPDNLKAFRENPVLDDSPLFI